MTDFRTRARREADIYDHHGVQRDRFEAALTYANQGPARIRRDEFIRTAMQDAHGKRVLEIGSQGWGACLQRFGLRPARLICINISESELEAGRAHARQYGADIDFQRMDAHQLSFEAESFDIVFGVAILHHLEFPRALREIHRVLRVGGKILFVEPLRLNPIARLVRRLTPQARTPDEVPLGPAQLALVDRNFATRNHFSEMLTVLGAVVAKPLFKKPVNPVTKLCDRSDQMLLRAIPGLGPYYRTVTLYGEKMRSNWLD